MGAEMPHSHASAYHFVPETQVVGVCDLLQERIDAFKEKWKPVLPDVKGYLDYKEMLAELKPDILSVVTSDNRHADIVVHAAENGVRAIFCEKPIATSLADADRMIAAVERNRVAMTINHTRRWLPIFRQVKAEVEKGSIGELKQIVVNFGDQRAMLFRNGTHVIDSLVFFAGSDPAWVFAELDEGYEDYWPYRGDGGRNADLEPGCSGYIHFKNGVRALYNGSRRARTPLTWQLAGTLGRIECDGNCATLGTPQGEKHIPSQPRVYSDSVAAVRELIHVMENGGETISSPRTARSVLEVILGFLASQKKGNVRINFPLDENAV
jgi:predicted dehydrogenase